MKKLLALLLFVAPLYCSAQTNDLKTDRKNDYCVMMPQQWGNQFNVYLDMGDKVPDSKNTLLKDDQGNTVKFKSMAAVLNYMEDEGWTMVTTYLKSYKSVDPDVIFIYKRPHKQQAQSAR